MTFCFSSFSSSLGRVPERSWDRHSIRSYIMDCTWRKRSFLLAWETGNNPQSRGPKVLGCALGKLRPTQVRVFRAMAERPSWHPPCYKRIGWCSWSWTYFPLTPHIQATGASQKQKLKSDHFLVKERVISDSCPKRYLSRNTMNICYEGKQIFATPRCVSLARGLFGVKGNQKQADPGKALYLPLNGLNLYWKGSLYQEEGCYQRFLLPKKLICIAGQPLFSHISSPFLSMASLPLVFPGPYSFPQLRMLYKPQLPGCLLILISLGLP